VKKGLFSDSPPKSTWSPSRSRRQPNRPFWTCGFAPLPSDRFALFARVFCSLTCSQIW